MEIAKQIEFFEPTRVPTDVDLSVYDRFIVAFSGGKDSLACLLHLFDSGVSPDKIELWHHDVDGRESERLYDWPISKNYCESVAQHFNIPIYFSWREGGIRREMLRENALTAGVWYEGPDGKHFVPSVDRPQYYNTRRKFPQVSTDLSVRWCTSYSKVMVSESALRNDLRFRKGKTLFITGERAEESTNRARYKDFEEHRADLRDGLVYKRYIDHWRPVLLWDELQVWDIIRKYHIRPHPAYYIGFGRTSCMCCVFLGADAFKTVSILDPKSFNQLAQYEKEFGYTMKRDISLVDLIKKGVPFEYEEQDAIMAMSETYDWPIITDNWVMPQGAFKGGCGPS